MHLIDSLRFHAQVRPFELAVAHARGSCTFLQLAGMVTRAGTRLREAGAKPGSTAAVYVNDPFTHLIGVLACLSEGIASVSAHPNREAPPETLKADIVLTDGDLSFKPSSKVVMVDPAWGDVRDAQNLPLPPRGFTDPQALCRLFTSSGTTGTQKLIGHTVARQETMALRALLLDPQLHGPVLSMMWMSTIGGWGTVQTALMHGHMVVLVSDPIAVLRAINLYQVRFLRASPQQLQSLIETVRGFPVRYPSLTKIELAGAAVPASVLLTARAVLCPTIVSIYGSTEAGLVAQAPAALLHAVPDAAGYVVPDVQVRIVDPDGAALPPGQEGTIQLRTPQLTDCYIGDPEATAACFRDGWFIPGDLGTLREDGLLRITGRIDEIINAGGVKVNPAVVDEFLSMQPGVADAAAFAYRRAGQPDQVWAAVVAKEGFDEKALIAAAVQRLNSRAPVKVVRVKEIPRNAMGKAMRQKLAQDASQ